MTDAIIVDIDECFCKTQFIFDEIHELGLKGEVKWDYYHANVHRCTINEWCAHLIRRVRAFNQIIFLTARSEAIREITMNFLAKGLGDFNFLLKMRPLDNSQASAELKRDHLAAIQRDYNILFAIDDEQSNCNMYKEAGIVTLKVM